MRKLTNLLISKVESEPEVVTQQGNTIFFKQTIRLKEINELPSNPILEGKVYHVLPKPVEDLKFEYIKVESIEINIKLASNLTGVKPRKLQEWCRNKLFESRKEKNKWIINVESFNEFLSLIIE